MARDPLLATAEEPARHRKKRLKHVSHFGTLEREHSFRHPSPLQSNYPEVHRLVAPLLDSFNALFDAADDDPTAADTKGLLSIGVQALDIVSLFDGVNEKNGGLGNKIECAYCHSPGCLFPNPHSQAGSVHRRAAPGRRLCHWHTRRPHLPVRGRPYACSAGAVD